MICNFPEVTAENCETPQWGYVWNWDLGSLNYKVTILASVPWWSVMCQLVTMFPQIFQ
jgi:hypothetical protein